MEQEAQNSKMTSESTQQFTPFSQHMRQLESQGTNSDQFHVLLNEIEMIQLRQDPNNFVTGSKLKQMNRPHSSAISLHKQQNMAHSQPNTNLSQKDQPQIDELNRNGIPKPMRPLSQGTQKKEEVFSKNKTAEEREILMLPSTPKIFKLTKRVLFARRMSHMDRPLIILNFQGLLGDFKRDPSSKQYLNLRTGVF